MRSLCVTGCRLAVCGFPLGCSVLLSDPLGLCVCCLSLLWAFAWLCVAWLSVCERVSFMGVVVVCRSVVCGCLRLFLLCGVVVVERGSLELVQVVLLVVVFSCSVVVGRGCFVVFVVVFFGSCFFFMRQIRQIRHFEKDFSIKKIFF